MPGHCRGCCGVGWREATVDCRLGALHGGWSGVNMPMGGGRGSASAMLALAGVGHSLPRYGIGSRAAAISWLRVASASLIRSTVTS